MSVPNESLSDQSRATCQPSGSDPAALGSPLDGRSHVRGETTTDLEHVTIPRMFRRAVSRHGPKDALVFCETGERKSYHDFGRDIDALASGLLALGLQKGDRVGIWSPNRYEWILIQFATARIGAILVNVNPAYRIGELEFVLNKVGCKALVLAPSFKSSDYLSMIMELAPELESCEPGQLNAARLPALGSVIVTGADPGPGAFTFDEVRDLGGPAQQRRLHAIDGSLSPDDAINIQFTSGTTGAPKGATLSHHNIVNNARFVTDRIRLTDADRLCIPVPLYHCFGMVMGVLGAVSKGAAMIFPGEAFEPRATLQALSKERCTAVYGVPTMFVAMLQELEGESLDLGSLRTGIMAGAPCPTEVMEQISTRMNLREITICYGMTETSPVSFQSLVDDPMDKRCATVGRVHPHVEVKIVDPEGNVVPVGERGELCTRGYAVMKGYWDDEEQTRESIVGGWMHTGDLATLDGEGYCSIVGRVKDMIIRGGENVYPREIEEFLFRHPDVSVAQVFGIPDERYGEEVCAWIIPKPGASLTEDAVREFCREQIAHYKVPRHVRIVEEIPMTISGKPQKFVMRDRMVELLSGPAK
ncbi:MAG: AMP-binding protein [Boseongicola sp.]|nr:AMP-binding protein [Boseongicola sp.]